MKATIGRIVIYNTTEEERKDMKEMSEGDCNVREQLPAIVVFASDEYVNLKVIMDGVTDFWIQSVKQGSNPGEWDFPVIQK